MNTALKQLLVIFAMALTSQAAVADDHDYVCFELTHDCSSVNENPTVVEEAFECAGNACLIAESIGAQYGVHVTCTQTYSPAYLAKDPLTGEEVWVQVVVVRITICGVRKNAYSAYFLIESLLM